MLCGDDVERVYDLEIRDRDCTLLIKVNPVVAQMLDRIMPGSHIVTGPHQWCEGKIVALGGLLTPFAWDDHHTGFGGVARRETLDTWAVPFSDDKQFQLDTAATLWALFNSFDRAFQRAKTGHVPLETDHKQLFSYEHFSISCEPGLSSFRVSVAPVVMRWLRGIDLAKTPFPGIIARQMKRVWKRVAQGGIWDSEEIWENKEMGIFQGLLTASRQADRNRIFGDPTGYFTIRVPGDNCELHLDNSSFRGGWSYDGYGMTAINITTRMQQFSVLAGVATLSQAIRSGLVLSEYPESKLR